MVNPLSMGSIVPSSRAPCNRVAAQGSCGRDQALMERSAGTGVLTRAVLAPGLDPGRFFVIEIVPAIAANLRSVLPRQAHVIEGDARALPDLVPAAWHGNIGAVIVGIPLLHHLATAAAKRGLEARREAWTPLNFPPASVWRDTPR